MSGDLPKATPVPLDLSIEEMRDLLTARDRLADPATPKSERNDPDPHYLSPPGSALSA